MFWSAVVPDQRRALAAQDKYNFFVEMAFRFELLLRRYFIDVRVAVHARAVEVHESALSAGPFPVRQLDGSHVFDPIAAVAQNAFAFLPKNVGGLQLISAFRAQILHPVSPFKRTANCLTRDETPG